jgi:xanthine phosphoribosyltransferase
MRALEERIKADGIHIGDGIIKVDSFMNHQIDPGLMQSIGLEFACRFKHTSPNKILTAETSGIAPALFAAVSLGIPIVFARKHQPITMLQDPYSASTFSPTHKSAIDLIVSKEYLLPNDRVLIIDDVLASGKTIQTLVSLIKQCNATVVGIGIVIDKLYAGGQQELAGLNIPVESLASIAGYDGARVLLG